MKIIIGTLAVLLALATVSSVNAASYSYFVNMNMSGVWLSNLNMGGYNITNVTGISGTMGAINISANNIALQVNNATGGRVFRVNTTSGKTEFWEPNMATGDYVEVYHDGTNGWISAASGTLNIGGANNYVKATTSHIVPSTSGYDVGSASLEWRGIYLGEDASSGAYFGLDQDWRMWYNETSDDALWLEGLTGISIAATNLKIWDDAKGASDYLQLMHDSSNAFIVPGSGYVSLRSSAGLDRVVASTNGVGICGQTSPAMGLHVGTGSSSHSLTNTNDTFVSGQLEVNGNTYFDNYVYFIDNYDTIWGTGGDSGLDWSTTQATENTLVWGLGDVSRSMIFTSNLLRNEDYDHPAQSNPTIFMQSAEDPDTSNVNWTSLSHDGVAAVLDSGTGSIVLDDTTTISGNIISGDPSAGTDRFRICYNGTESLINIYSSNSTLFNCYVNNTGSFLCNNIATWSCT